MVVFKLKSVQSVLIFVILMLCVQIQMVPTRVLVILVSKMFFLLGLVLHQLQVQYFVISISAISNLNCILGGFLCLDVDECLDRTHDCDQTCINLPGTFACKCDQGFAEYMGDGTTCTDNDECNLNTHNCHENADCFNIPNAFQCDCKVGYTGNGVHCKNINECMENSDNCPYDSQCTDTEGTYTCSCNPGYKDAVIDGVEACVNIDECASPSTPPLCATDASCIDTRSGIQSLFFPISSMYESISLYESM